MMDIPKRPQSQNALDALSRQEPLKTPKATWLQCFRTVILWQKMGHDDHTNVNGRFKSW
jgi:hypothetical protein